MYRVIFQSFLCTEADDVISSVHLNQHQLSAAWRRALVLAVHTSPVKQFGIGFGIGWSAFPLSDINIDLRQM